MRVVQAQPVADARAAVVAQDCKSRVAQRMHHFQHVLRHRLGAAALEPQLLALADQVGGAPDEQRRADREQGEYQHGEGVVLER